MYNDYSHRNDITSLSVAGVWQRRWEQDPLGGDAENADTTTLVLWTQSPESGIYVDLRFPQGAPGRSKEAALQAGYTECPQALEGTGLSVPIGEAASAPPIELLTKQKSFAGILKFSWGDTTESGEALAKDTELADLAAEAPSIRGALPLCTCFWRRNIDFQPPTGSLDIGVCASGAPNAEDGSIDLRETGDDGSYAELWHRLPGSNDGPFLALELISENDFDRVGYWVRTGNFFAYAVGRPKTPNAATSLGCHAKSGDIESAVGKSLLEAVTYLESEANNQIQLIGSYIAMAGVVEQVAIESSPKTWMWKIQHSTDPALVGCLLVGSRSEELCCSTITAEDASGSTKATNEIVIGDILSQFIVGNEGRVRKWKVVEISGPSSLPAI